MFRLELDVTDLAEAGFVVSPLHEVGSKPYGLCTPAAGAGRTGNGRAGCALCLGWSMSLLASLVSLRGWIPDFADPPPMTPRPEVAARFAQVRATSPDRVYADVLATYGPATLPQCLKELIDDPAELRDRVADALELLWSLAIAPRWPQIRARLEADLLHRGQQLAYRGPGMAFGGLDSRDPVAGEHDRGGRYPAMAQAGAGGGRAGPAAVAELLHPLAAGADRHRRPASALLSHPGDGGSLARARVRTTSGHQRAAWAAAGPAARLAGRARVHHGAGRAARGNPQRGLPAPPSARRRRAGDPRPGRPRGPIPPDRNRHPARIRQLTG